MCIDPAKRYTALMETSKGSLTFALDPIAAPRTVNNFVFLARYHYFDGIAFHRIIPGFVIQGGDPTGNGTGGPGYRFADELPKAGRYEIVADGTSARLRVTRMPPTTITSMIPQVASTASVIGTGPIWNICTDISGEFMLPPPAPFA